MKIGNITIDTNEMSVEELDALIKEAKRIRSRKNGAREFYYGFEDLLSGAKDRGYALCSRYTGEVLKASDWVVYDEQERCEHWTFNHIEEE